MLFSLQEDSDSTEGRKVEPLKLPLFETILEPAESEVGNIINLQCGHAAKPSELEAQLIHQHLIEAGMVPGISNL